MIVRMKNKIHPYDKTGARACGCYPRGSRGYEIAGMEAFPDGCPAEPHCWPGRHNHWRRISSPHAPNVKHSIKRFARRAWKILMIRPALNEICYTRQFYTYGAKIGNLAHCLEWI